MRRKWHTALIKFLMKTSPLCRARRNLRPVSVAVVFMSLFALPASSWGCTAQGNSIIVNPCANVQYGDALVQFEADSVQAYLTLHGLPSTDSLVVYGYGRSDLRTEIRGLMLVRLLAIVSKAPSDRNSLETSIYNWYLNRVWQNEISMAAAAVADKTNFLADKCDWTPDPDIASQYGFVYEGGAFCTSQLLQLFASPTVPAESYFQAAAFKRIYGGSISSQPGGPSIMAATLSSLATTQAYATIPVIAAAVTFSSAVGQNITSILLATAQRLSLAAKTAARAIEAGLEVTEDVEPEIIAGESSLGPGLVVGVMLEAGVSAATEAWDADQTVATLGDLDTRYTAAQAAPPDLLSFLNDDSGTGILKLNASFVSATLPEVFVVTDLPAHRSTDPMFQISTGGGTPVSSAQLIYRDWNNNVWTASTWGGWFVQSNVSNGNTFYSITATLRGLYPGSPVNDQITVGRYSADRFVTAPTNSFNIACPIDPATGESDTQGNTAIEFCSSFVVRQLPLLNGSGVLQTVTLPLQALPAFPDGPTRILNFKTNSSNTQAYILSATGFPLPSLSAVSGALPPGFTFVDSATLGIPGQAEIVAPLNITPGSISLTPFTVQATNSSGSVTQALTLNYSQGPIVFHSPNSLTLTRGVPATFNVVVQGKPPLEIAPFFTPSPDGMTFVDHGGGSGTLSGTPALDAVGCDPSVGGPCVFSAFDADGNELSQFFTITMLPPPAPLLGGPASATFAVGRLTTAQFHATGGQTQTHFTATIPAAIAGFLSLTDFGDGTAQLAAIPPPGSSGTYGVKVFLTADGVPGSVQTNFSVIITGPPVFISAATSFAHTRVPSVFTIGTSEPATFTLSGYPPPGTVFTSNPGGQNSTATLSFAPTDGSGGVYPLFITATNAYGITSQYLAANVLEAPTFTSGGAKLMVGVNRQIGILTNGFPRNAGFTLDTGVISAGIGIAGGGSQLPAGTTIKPAAADGSNSGEVILSGVPAAGSQGSYGAGLFASSELGFSQEIYTISVYAAGDANGDGVVSCADVTLVKASLNKKKGQTGYNPDADINSDGVVDIKDLAFVTAQLAKGTKCQ